MRRRDIVRALALRPGMAVADVGTGTGLFVPSLAAAVGPTGRVYAVDIAPKFVAYVRERARADGLTQVRAVLGTADDPRLDPHSVDVAFLADTYHHLDAPAATLAAPSAWAAVSPWSSSTAGRTRARGCAATCAPTRR